MATKTSIDENVSRETSEANDTCSRCENPLDATGSPAWCKACRAKYQREYQRTRKEMSESRGFAAGISAAKEFIAQCFEQQVRRASVTGIEAASYVRDCNTNGL